ncbi:alpha/beta hydrolase family protein [Prauserella muralis]|uniref:Uncharacterized protein n=1 Tax=Prauserella muralis TaxID=588067 RepID=A0A2V4AZA3_9PSEU|nr:hypothetical protein [Prauserella muralis]PXY27063.1 hypothetical protein BAY60_11280 [Prauserella muralis]TWE23309.1 hypothetical protein FHX69_4570 [Prauserella muralis]
MSGRRWFRAAGLALLAVLLAAVLPATATAKAGRSHTGTIDGAAFRVEVPPDWNGTLVLFSHGYYPPGIPLPPEVALTTHPRTEQWLLDHGYALAGSDYKVRTGFAVADALEDQVAVLDWFREHVADPRTVVGNGMSMGGGIAARLAELHPGRFDGVLTQCAEYDFNGSWNTALDINFVVRTLLAPGEDIDLVEPRDPQGSTDRLLAAVRRALETEQGRARLALAGALGNIPGWYSVPDPEPELLIERIRQQASWIHDAYIWGIGPAGRVDLEQRVGGNPSGNAGVDYRRQLARSAYRDLVRQAYGHDPAALAADLRLLQTAPRITADDEARRFVDNLSAHGTTPAPVLTMHNTGDGGAIADQQRWYAEQVRRHGDPQRLRQLYVDRGYHCAFSAAEEIVALRALLHRVETGHWGDLRPRHLDAAVAAFDEPYRRVLDFGNPDGWLLPPAFTRFVPPRFLRPSF